MINNFNQVEVIADTDKPDFIILSETHVTDRVDESELQLEGYNAYVTLSNSSRTGGIIVYFNKNWKVNIICEKIRNYKYWISAYNIRIRNTSMIIVAVYRSPSSQDSEFYEVFEQTIEEICDKNIDIIVAGDFNVDWSKEGFYKQKLQQIISDNGLVQVITDYTRITRNSRTIIDYVITNNLNIKVNNSRINKISDHEIVEMYIETKVNKEHESKRQIELFKYEKRKFRREISEILKFDENVELNYNVNNFDKSIEDTIKKLTVRKTIREKSRVNKWFNRQLQALKKDKIVKYHIAKCENTTVAWNNYKNARNIYKIKLEN